jgi:dsDNA-specific endonuclease/ATPase MutS2
MLNVISQINAQTFEVIKLISSDKEMEMDKKQERLWTSKYVDNSRKVLAQVENVKTKILSRFKEINR